jgi:branched-subunit amino acid aminotransferase/4-amino-4-deoxychorismate lyase
VHEHEVGRVDELFLVGTTMEVTSIVRLDSHAVGDGRPGPHTVALRAAYRRRTGR